MNLRTTLVSFLLLEGWLQYPVAEAILARGGQDLKALEAQAAKGSITPIPLGLNASVSIENTITFAESYNVGAVRTGTEAADELFIYMAHWDHLGTTAHEDGEEGDFIYNGAEDNASGTAGLLEVAEAWANTPDGLNFRGKMSDIVVVGYGGSEMEDILAGVARESGRTLTPEATPEKGFYYRSDHFNFAKNGVPILYAKGGTTDREHGADYQLGTVHDVADQMNN